MALESILFRRYTHQSDVWSYGEFENYSTSPSLDVSVSAATLNVSRFRCNNMGDDVIWSRAIHFNASTGSS